MRAVVTGGAGFVGRHLCARLLDEEWEVVCVDNFVTGMRENIQEFLGRPGFTSLDLDISQGVNVPGQVDYVLHFASPASPPDYLKYPIETLKAGSAGTINALDLACEKGGGFLLASTSEVYGDPEVHPQPESYWGRVNPIGPRSVYDEAKRFGEALTMAYRRTHGLRTTIVRIFNTHGPYMRKYDGRAVPTFARQALAGESLTVTGDGSQTRSVIYIDDLVEGIWRAMLSGHPGPMNIGNPHEVSVLQLAETIIKLSGSSSGIEYVPRPVDDPTVRRPDISLARAELAWSPVIGFEEGLEKTLDYFNARRNYEHERCEQR